MYEKYILSSQTEAEIFLKEVERQLITQAHEDDPIPKNERNKVVV